MSHLLGLPDLQHRHAGNDGVGILLGGRVHRVIGADHQSQVRLWLDAQQIQIKILSLQLSSDLMTPEWHECSSQLILSHMCQTNKITAPPLSQCFNRSQPSCHKTWEWVQQSRLTELEIVHNTAGETGSIFGGRGLGRGSENGFCFEENMGDGKSEIMRSYENTCNRFHKRLMTVCCSNKYFPCYRNSGMFRALDAH